MRRLPILSSHGLWLALALTAACANPSHDPAVPDPHPHPWSPEFDPPTALDTDRVHLEPLHPQHTAADYAAFMSSVDHLHRTLHWGPWPRPDFTLEENRRDLERHWKEFEAREAYAFTVQSSDRTRCVGCIYVNPVAERRLAPGVPRDPRAATLDFWVIESELATDLDRHLLAATLDWLERDWPFSVVYVPLHRENERGLAVARELGLVESPDLRYEGRVALRRPAR